VHEYEQEEAAKHPVPDGKYVKVQCVHKSVPRITELSPRGPASCSSSVQAPLFGMAIHNESFAQQRPPRPEPIYYCATGAEMPAFEPCKEMKGHRDI
jgi:hypothetical protein